MQISRHWRLNAQRYRLQGVRYENGQTSLQARPIQADALHGTVEKVREITSGEKDKSLAAAS